MLKNHTLRTDSLVVVALLAMLQSLPVSAADVPAQLPAPDGRPGDGTNAVRVIKAKPADATSLQRLGEAVLASKPLAYWRMHDKDGAVADDASPNERNGTYEKGASPYSPGGKVSNLTGGRVRAALETLADTYSVELWIWNETPHHERPITGYMFSRGRDGSKSAPGDNLGIGGTHVAAGRLFLFNGNQRNQVLEGSTQLVPRTWNHVVMVRQKNEVAVYLNGDTEPEIQGQLAVTYEQDGGRVFIGGRSDNFANLVGRIDEVALYDRALTPQEAKAHFDAAGVTLVEGPTSDPPAQPAAPVPTEGETEHFWYRLAPADPYIDSQRDNKAFAFRDGTILLSEDNGKTWPHSAEFPDAKNITYSCLLKNGNILFATSNKLYLSTDKLKTYEPITVRDRDGSDYLPHTPRNPNQPGWYFHALDAVHTWDVDGTEMLVWGNYCNVLGGPVPVNIYYSIDQGRTVKIAYSFGRNPRYTNGGTPLGDPDNPVICRHIHSVAYNPNENAFYACTGDHDLKTNHECHWLRGLYNRDKDTWTWKVLASTDSNTRYKSGGINFVEGKLYWTADANGTKPHDRGIFRCDPADITTASKHTMLFHPKYPVATMIIEDGVILAGHIMKESPFSTGIIVSPDMGRTWAQYDLSQFGQRFPIRFHRKNSDGWFRVDLHRGRWIERGEVLFIKPK